jgi:hypothetical protein
MRPACNVPKRISSGPLYSLHSEEIKTMKDNSDAVFISHTTAVRLADRIGDWYSTNTTVLAVMLRGKLDGYKIHVQGQGNLSNDAADAWQRQVTS